MQRAEEKKHCRHSDGYPVARVASDSFKIRRATLRDADIIAWHRARMFQDMADVSGDAFEILRAKSRTRLEQWLDSGGYNRLACNSGRQTGDDCWRRWCSVTTDPATPGRHLYNWRRPAGDNCECFHRTAMATTRNRQPPRQRDRHLVEGSADRPSLASRFGRRPLAL